MSQLCFNKNTSPQSCSEYFKQVENSKLIEISIEDSEYSQGVDISFLCDHIKLSDKVEHFQITIASKCILSEANYEDIGQALQCLKSLKSFSLQVKELCYLKQEGLISISRAIAQYQSLKFLMIVIDKYNFIQSEGLITLSNSLKNLTNLQKLLLSVQEYDDAISSDELLCLFSMLQHHNQLMELTLRISTYAFDESCSIALGKAIQELNKLVKLSLFLSGSSAEIIENTFAQCFGLLADLQNLELTFEFNNYIGKQLLESFVQSFSLLSALQYLKIEGLVSKKDTESEIEIQKIFQFTPNLKQLFIDISFLTCSDNLIFSYSESIKHLNKIEQLQLTLHPKTLNNIDSFVLLLQSIQKMKTISDFNLTIQKENKLNERCGEEIGQILLQLPNLRQLRIELGEKTMPYSVTSILFNYLGQLTKLEKLILQLDCTISKKSCLELAKSLTFLEGLIDFELLNLRVEKKYTYLYGLYFDDEFNEDLNKEIENSILSLKNIKSFNFNKRINILDSKSQIHILPTNQEYELKSLDFCVSRDINEQILEQLAKVQNLKIYINKEQFSQNEKASKVNFFKNLTNLKRIELFSISDLTFNNTFFNGLITDLNLDSLETLQIVFQNENWVEQALLKLFQKLPYLKDLELCFFQQDQTKSNFLENELEQCFSQLTGLQRLKLNLGENYSRFKKALLRLPKLSELNIQISGGRYSFLKPDLIDLISNLPDVKIVTIKSAYPSAENYIDLLKVLQTKESLHEFKMNFQNNTLVDSYENCQDIRYYQQYYPNQLPLRKVLFLEKPREYDFKFKNMLALELLLSTEEEFILQQFEQILDQIRQLRYLHQLLLILADSSNTSSFYGLQVDKKDIDLNQQTYDLRALPENYSTQKRQLKKFSIYVDNFLFNHYHAQMIGRELKYFYNQIEHFCFHLYFRNNIGDGGLSCIFENLQYLTHLRLLEIQIQQKTYFGEASVLSLGKSLKNFKYLQKLIIHVGSQETKLGEIGPLADGLQHCTNLEHLEINFAHFLYFGGGLCLVVAMKQLINLRYIKIQLGTEFKIESTTTRDINLISQNNIFKFSNSELNCFNYEVLKDVNSSIVETLEALLNIPSLIVELVVENVVSKFMERLIQFISSTQMAIAIFLEQIHTSYNQEKSFTNYVNHVEQLITVLCKLVPQAIYCIDLSMGVNCEKEQTKIIICKNENKQLNILLKINVPSFKNEYESEILRILTLFMENKLSYELKLDMASLNLIDSISFSNIILQILSSARFVHSLKFKLKYSDNLSNEDCIKIFNKFSQLTKLNKLYLETPQQDNNQPYNIRSYLRRKCKRLCSFYYDSSSVMIEEVD